MSVKKQVKLGIPDYITVETEERKQVLVPDGAEIHLEDITVKLEDEGGQEKIYLTAQESAVKYLKLRWNRKAPEKARVLRTLVPVDQLSQDLCCLFRVIPRLFK